MNKKDKILKRLAEAHYYLGAPLTMEQQDLLEESKYIDIIKSDNRFDSLIEQTMGGESSRRRRGRPHRRGTFLNREALIVLIDEIELTFDLDIDNSDLNKYEEVDISDLKSFISKYADGEVDDAMTKNFLDSLIENSEDVYRILHGLYARLG